MKFDDSFAPQGILANTHVQTLLSSSLYRRKRILPQAAALLAASEKWVLDGGDGIRLLGFYSAQAESAKERGLVILIHGWEGSSESNYLLATASTLFNQGFDTLRLNLRDHGDSHHLNEGIFHSRMIEEVVHAIADACSRISTRPVFMVGFSLGANFTLRVALRAPVNNIPLQHVVAVCPVIRPHDVLDALESGIPIYEYYFNRKWEKSLRKKEQLFPQRYDFSRWYKMPRLRDRTEDLVVNHTPWDTLEEYLDGYSLVGDALSELAVPTTIVATLDDPVIPVAEVEKLPATACLERVYTRKGGHCAFLENWQMHSWIENYILGRFEQSISG
ncbi:MAG: alpha/beta fold hydrolase [Xanthomonadales bacterium]|nr:alpha/beta fold hydrolase [Xanthomonadales bacterium]